MSRISSLSRQILHEPLVPFVLLAGLLFLLDFAFSSTRKETVVVERQTAQYLVKQREDMEMRKLSPEERRNIVDSYVIDEILYSEAYKRGLDRGDSRMRRNMILKMRGLLTDEIKAPSDQQLSDYFEVHRAAYAYPANWSLQQVFFADPSLVPAGLLDRLNSGLNPNTLGEFRPGMGRRLPRRSQRELVGLFGPEATQFILDIPETHWHGPVESPQGVHFLRVTDREPGRDADFQHIKEYLERDWAMAQGDKVVRQEIERLRNNYEIVIEDYEE